MASMRDIKRRKVSIQSTQQITKAMKLVSTVKLQKAKAKAEKTKDYFDCMYDTVSNVLARTTNLNHPFLNSGESGKKAIIVITSNRGLAGGYNNNIVKLVTSSGFDKDNSLIYAIGRKGEEALDKRGYTIEESLNDMIEAPVYADAMGLCGRLLAGFSEGKISEIYLAYTAFKNTVVHEPKLLKLLPVEANNNSEELEEDKTESTPMNFEPEDDEALDLIIPKYITSLIYGGMVEAVASENGARMQAMDSATSNATEMIDDLTLMYNRARQGSITQELTEIIAGANAIS